MSVRTSSVVSLLCLAGLAASALGDPCPTITKLDKGAGSNDSSHFGKSLSMSFGGLNSTPLLVVGEPGLTSPSLGANSGGFTVYAKNGNWSQVFAITNLSGQGGEQLGSAIDLADPYLIAGAPGYNFGQGRAKIYRRPSNGSGYAFNTDLYAPGLATGTGFGTAVAVSAYGGGWAVVGASGHSFGGTQSGGAYFYTRDVATNVWTETYHIWGGDFGGQAFDRRGAAVAMSQSTEFAAVGAPESEATGQPSDHGEVIVVKRLANGFVSGQVQFVRPPSPEAGEHFGASVAIEGSVMIVGAPDEDLSLLEGGFQQQTTDSGAAYVYRRDSQSGEWVFEIKLRSPTPASGAKFGTKVATDGWHQYVVSEPGSKRAYLFSSANGGWKYQGAISDPDAEASGSFASDVAVHTFGEIAIGDNSDDDNGLTNSGAAYVASISHDTLTGDRCADAIELPLSGDVIGCTDLATPSGFTSATCGAPASQGPDVFYKFTPTCDGNAIFDTFGSEFDTVLSVHTGCPSVFAHNTLVCNDDSTFSPPNNRASLVTFNFVAGETYFVRVSGYNGASGQFTLRHLYTFSSPNDLCQNATSIGIETRAFGTCAATSSSPAIATCTAPGFGATRDVWFRFTPAAAGNYVADTCGTGFDTVLSVFDASHACPMTAADMIACGDDVTLAECSNYLTSRVPFSAAAGQSLLIRVAGFGASDYGMGQLTISPGAPTPPCPADFNGDGELNPDDLGDYINCYFSVPPCGQADINDDGDVNPDDLGDYINAYFAGCP